MMGWSIDAVSVIRSSHASRMSYRRAPVSGPKETRIEVSYRHEQFWPPHSPALFDEGKRVTRSAVR